MDDNDGSNINPEAVRFSPGNGGDGGSVTIKTDKYVQGGSNGIGLVRAGGGGNGGNAAESLHFVGLNGTAAHPDAWSVDIRQSSGGAGGSIKVTSEEHAAVHPIFEAGNGGWAGPLSATIYGGNGYCTAADCVVKIGGGISHPVGVAIP